MSEIREQQRRKVVVMASSLACMSGGTVLLRDHGAWMWGWVAMMALVLALVIVEANKLKRMPQ